MSIKFPLGLDSFSKIREGKFYYVDKTNFISELLNKEFEATLITRPRRFGKTLTMSMLEDFFDISKESTGHFEGLKISEEAELCREWMNQWPVIFLTLKNVEANRFELAYCQLEALISDFCIAHKFLAESERVNEFDRALALRFMAKKSSEEEIRNSLYTLTRMMSAHYGKPVILLIDEYDVPLAKANDGGYYREMLDVIRAMLGAALKTNPYLKFAVITGCLKISKESIFTGLNNVVANTITEKRFDEFLGFTEADVQKLLADAGFTDHADEIRNWYDGYRFGAVDVYCPWDVLNHVAALQVNSSAQPENYWAATSHNEIIYRLFETRQFDINGKFEALMAGGDIREKITEDLTYDSLETSEENLWSLLFMTGYLTKAKGVAEEIPTKASESKITALRIPNEEIKSLFQTMIIDWFKKDVQTADRTEIFRALWEGDTKTASSAISDLLFNTISYHDYKESYYHAFTAGLFAGAGYIVESNYEYGDGRPDVVIKDKRKRRVMLLEAKHAETWETLEHACEKAVKQIREKRYAEAFDGYRTIISYGIAFRGKDCMVKK